MTKVEQRGNSKKENSYNDKHDKPAPRYSSWGDEIKITIPTSLTLTRMALTPFISISIFYKHTFIACILFCIAAFTDLLDGLIARLFRQETLLGKLLDPIADKILLNTVNIILSFGGIFTFTIPGWLTLIIISRDLLIIASVSLIVVAGNYKDIYPSWTGKLSTICQFISIIGVLIMNLSYRSDVAILLQFIFYITLLFIVISGFLYLLKIAKIFRTVDKNNI